MKITHHSLYRAITLGILFFPTLSLANNANLIAKFGTLQTSLEDLAQQLAPSKKNVKKPTTKSKYFTSTLSLVFNGQNLEKTFGMQDILKKRIEGNKAWYDFWSQKCLELLPLNKNVSLQLLEVGLEDLNPNPDQEAWTMEKIAERIGNTHDFTNFVAKIKELNFTWHFDITAPDNQDDRYITAQFSLPETSTLDAQQIILMSHLEKTLSDWIKTDPNIWFKNPNPTKTFSVPLAKISKECNFGKIKQKLQIPLTLSPFSLDHGQIEIEVYGPTIETPIVGKGSWGNK